MGHFGEPCPLQIPGICFGLGPHRFLTHSSQASREVLPGMFPSSSLLSASPSWLWLWRSQKACTHHRKTLRGGCVLHSRARAASPLSFSVILRGFKMFPAESAEVPQPLTLALRRQRQVDPCEFRSAWSTLAILNQTSTFKKNLHLDS